MKKDSQQLPHPATGQPWHEHLTTAVAIGLICGLADAALLQFNWMTTDKVEFLPGRVWIVCPVAWAMVCVAAAVMALVVRQPRLVLPLVFAAGPGALAFARVVAAVRFVSPSWRAYVLPLTVWLLLLLIGAWALWRTAWRPAFVRRPAVLLSVWLLFAGACSAIPLSRPAIPSAPQEMSTKPNVVLIFLDTLRQDYSGLDGSPNQAPNLARFASGGRVFTNAWAPFPWTLPSHLSVMTGYSAEELLIDFEHQRYAATRRTLAEAFRSHDYFTAGFSSNPWLNPGSGFTRGFDHYEYSEADLDLCRSGIGFFIKLIPNARAPICRWTGAELTDAAIEVVRSARKPYFLSLNYMEPHLPLYVPSVCRPPGYKPFDPMVAYPLIDRAHRTGVPIPPEQEEHFKRNYEIAIRCLDRDLQRLFTAIDQSGDGERTIIAVVSDHGEQFGEHGLSLHANSVYRQVLRVPLVLRGPGVPRGVEDRPVSATWLYRTLLDLARIPAPRRAIALPLDDSTLVAEPVLSLHRAPKRERNVPARIAVDRWSAVAGRHHLIIGANGEIELYDTVADPEETRNLASDPQFRGFIENYLDRGRRHLALRAISIEETDRLFSLGYLQ